ncbi:MFS transporter [Nonomuraea sp. NPDC050663]|uniref:MFS transporter n=1 Tax=Nonomuraea sp. NPDC050663 TaxID=3364370 RepID=UPI0037A56F32
MTALDIRPAEVTETPEVEAPAYRWRWAALGVILAGSVMELLDATVTHIAGPTMRADLGGGNSLIQWLGAAYILAMTAGLLIGGRLGDIVGRKRMFLIGLAGFTVGSLLCAIAVSPETIIGARIIQGLFGAAMIPQGMGLMKEMFRDKELTTAFGLFGPVLGLSAVGGPILAGALVSGPGWRMIFLINLPIGIAAAIAAIKFLPSTRPTGGVKLDIPGALLASLGTVLIVFPLIQGGEHGWPLWSFVMMAASVVVFALFVVYEKKRKSDQLIVPSLFRKPAFLSGLAVGAIYFAAFGGIFAVLGFYTQQGLGFSPLKAALTSVPSSVGMIVGMGIAQATVKYGRKVLLAGAVVMGLGSLAVVAIANPAVTPWQLAPALVFVGLGSGLIMGPFYNIVLAAVDPSETGSASGTLTAVQQIGNALGLAVLGTIFFTTKSGAITFGVAAAMIAVTFVVGLLLPKQAREDVEFTH